MLISKTTKALLDWAESPVAATFPYGAALAAVRLRGKHFITSEVLEALVHARQQLNAAVGGPDPFLKKFLNVILDKYDNQYNYLSYTALTLLEHVRLSAEGPAHRRLLQHIHDVTVCSLIGDAMRFELRRLDGATSYLSDMLPSHDLIERRLAFALRSLAPSLERLGFDELDADESISARVERVVDFCGSQSLAHSQFMLDVSMQPVYVVHDEYLFIRILQTLDTTFVSVATLLRDALQVFDEAPLKSIPFICAGDAVLQEGLRHFHTLSTMQREAFATFREFTTGASAIQSVNYKVMETLCSRPGSERLESLAYGSVPALQEQLRAGGTSLNDKLHALRLNPHADPAVVQALVEALRALGDTLTRWRHSHYGIARKYLGEAATGTGYTEGTPYLKMVKDLQVFPAISPFDNAQGKQ